jgi:hypothetical protein
MENIKNIITRIEYATAAGDYEAAWELSQQLELATVSLRRQIFMNTKSAQAAARKAQEQPKKYVARTVEGEVKHEFTSDAQNLTWTYIVGAENGEEKFGKGFDNIESAQRGMKSMLKAYDKKRLAAWGQVLKVEVAA